MCKWYLSIDNEKHVLQDILVRPFEQVILPQIKSWVLRNTCYAILCYVILYYKLFMFQSLDMEIWKPWSSQVHPEAQPKGVHATDGC
jgi:hypothetical protein